jgi:geranylgeranyl diphosphate synthase type II
VETSSNASADVGVTGDVHRATARLMAEGTRRAERHGSHVHGLWQIAADQLRGGKLLRPRLLLEMFDALSASFPSRTGRPVAERAEAVRLAAAVEVLHFAFLLHDDVIDNDLTRRGRPNLVGTLLGAGSSTRSGPGDGAEDGDGSSTESPGADARRSHWARSAAILVGDQMLALAHQVFARADLPRSERLQLLDALGDAVAESAVGEFLDVSLSDGIIEPEEAVIAEMTRTKTATYTFELPLRAACVLAGAPESAARALTSAGPHLGIAFQLQDDALSAFGTTAEHGKDSASDLREGKQTAITAFARTTPEWPLIHDALQRDELQIDELQRDEQQPDDLGGARTQDVGAMLADCGAEAHVDELIAGEVSRARDALADAAGEVPAAARDVLEAVIGELEGRTR